MVIQGYERVACINIASGLIRFVIVIGLLMVTASPAPAATEEASFVIEEIIVTAERRAVRLQETPVSITAFTAASLARKEVTNLMGIGRFTPNVEINSSRVDNGGSSFNAYIRGVGQQDFLFPNDPGVGLYVDGVYLPRTAGGALDLSDVERIEVLRGPQGTLYGRNTIGGAVKIISRSPVIEGDWTGSIEGTTGRYQRADFKAYVTGPLIDGKLGVKLAVAVLHRNGYSQSLRQDLGDEGKQIGKISLKWQARDDLSVTLRAGYQRQRQNGPVGSIFNRFNSAADLSGLAFLLTTDFPGSPFGGAPPFAGVVDPTPQNPFMFDDFYNAFIVPYQNQQLGLPAGTLFDARWISDDPAVSFGTGPSADDNEIYDVSVTAEWDVSENILLKSITAFRDMEAQIPQDADHSPYPAGHLRTLLTQDQISQEFQLIGDSFEGRMQWVAGAYYMHENAFDNNKVDLLSGLYEVLNPVAPFLYFVNPTDPRASDVFSLDFLPRNKINVDSYAVFGQFTYDVTEKLSATLGGRWSKDEKTYIQDHGYTRVPDPRFGPGFPGLVVDTTPIHADGLARFVGPRTLKDSWASFTPKVGIDYHLTPDNLVYASWSKGFKSGGWSPRPTANNGTDLPFDEEILLTAEIGSKNLLMNSKMTVNLAAFYSDYQDLQLTTIGTGGAGAGVNLLLLTRNVGDAKLYGGEIEIVARPVAGLDLEASIGYLHNKWDQFNRDACNPTIFDATGGQFCDADLSLDDKLVDSPKWTMNFGAQYAFPIGDFGSLALRGDASYRSKTFKDPNNFGAGPNYLGEIDRRQTLPAPSPGSYYGITLRELSQEGYWLLNLRAAFAPFDEDWEVALGVTNLANKKYITALTPITAFGYDMGNWGRPREWSLSVRYSF